MEGAEGRAALVGVPVIEPPRFEELFERYHARLFAGLCLVTESRDEAEEIAQEAFLRVWQRWDRVSAMDDPAGYLFRTAMNLLRKRARRTRVAARRALGLAPRPDAFGQVDDRDALIRAMRDLTPHERAAIVLTALEEYSSREAGEMLGVADSTVRVLAARARASMRSAMEGGER
jgi:RNA polymerase sigma-70 factor (ECF subfamily)